MAEPNRPVVEEQNRGSWLAPRLVALKPTLKPISIGFGSLVLLILLLQFLRALENFNADSFMEIFTWIWIAGGVLLIPFNSLTTGMLICLRTNFNYETWQGIVKTLWVLQVVWNIVFFTIGLIVHEATEPKITYTLTQIPRPLSGPSMAITGFSRK